MKHTGEKIAQWLTLVSLVAMFGFAGIAEQVDKLSPGLVAGMFLSVLAFEVVADRAEFVESRQKAEGWNSSQEPPAYQAQQTQQGFEEIAGEDDLPF